MTSFLALWLLCAPANADDLLVESRVSDVVVFRDKARVTRVVTAKVPAGRTDLLLDGLPIHLLADSLSVAGEGTAAATLLGVDVRTVRGTEERDARVAEVDRALRTLDEELRVHRDEVARATAAHAFVVGLAPKAPAQLSDRAFLADDAPAQLATLARQVREDAAAALAAKRTAEIKLRGLQSERDALQRDRDQLTQAAGTDANRVAVGIDAKRAGEVTVRVTYLTSQVSWTPHYDARFDVKTNRVDLTLSGDVVQRTGEDWSAVKLTLSTAAAEQRTAPPALEPFWLGQSPGRAVVGRSQAASAAIEYAVPRVESIASDGSRRRVRLESLDLTATMRHQVVPRRGAVAWLVAVAPNPSERALFGGSLSSYLGGAYLGEGTIAPAAPGQPIEVPFGVDDRVRVVRKRLVDSEGGPKVLGNRERVQVGYETAVTNRTGAPTTVIVLEQIPASRDAAFVVKPNLDPDTSVDADGRFRWEVTLKDGEERKFQTRYEVTWPQGDRPILLD